MTQDRKPLFELNGMRGDRWVHQSFWESREDAVHKVASMPDMMVVVWDRGYDPIQPVWWARLERGSEFYRQPVLEYEAWLAEANSPRLVTPRPPKQSLREIKAEQAWANGQDWTDIPPTGPHVVETPAQRIHYMDGKRVGRQCLVPETGEWGEMHYGE